MEFRRGDYVCIENPDDPNGDVPDSYEQFEGYPYPILNGNPFKDNTYRIDSKVYTDDEGNEVVHLLGWDEKYISNRFRYEVKYTLTPFEYLKFRDFCSGFMDCDKNAGKDGIYTVKSYYFDTLYYDDYFEKLNGIYERQKYRIRTYGNTGYYRLEKKIKKGILNRKESGEISADNADKLIKGHLDIKTGVEKTDNIISEMFLKGCRHSTYIEYTRQAFMIKELDLRITFDEDLGVLYGNNGLYETKTDLIPLFYDDSVILEIKYKDTLPRWLEKAVHQTVPSEYSISKYAKSLQPIFA